MMARDLVKGILILSTAIFVLIALTTLFGLLNKNFIDNYPYQPTYDEQGRQLVLEVPLPAAGWSVPGRSYSLTLGGYRHCGASRRQYGLRHCRER